MKVTFNHKVKYDGVWHPSNTIFEVKEDDLEELKRDGAIIIGEQIVKLVTEKPVKEEVIEEPIKEEKVESEEEEKSEEKTELKVERKYNRKRG